MCAEFTRLGVRLQHALKVQRVHHRNILVALVPEHSLETIHTKFNLSLGRPRFRWRSLCVDLHPFQRTVYLDGVAQQLTPL